MSPTLADAKKLLGTSLDGLIQVEALRIATRSVAIEVPSGADALCADKARALTQSKLVLAKCAVMAATCLLLGSCGTSSHVSFLDPQGPVAAIQRSHFLDVLALLTLFVALPIFLLLPWFAWRYRYRAKSSLYTPRWKFFWPLELATWAGPAVIVALLGILVWRSTHTLDPYRPLASDKPVLRVQVIGYDWKWLFIYPDEGVASVGLLALPAGRPIAMQLTSATVLQSLQIPALGSQIYAMGGMVTQLHLEATKSGSFLGENTMYNGDGFHQQQFVTVAMTPEAFEEWVRKTKANGMALDAAALGAISQRGTRAQLVAALGHASSPDGNVYFKGATSALFTATVMATMNGTVVTLPDPGAKKGTVGARAHAESAVAKKP